ncbi:MAG TPA: type I restriction enzyme endonuclease domain-containing protein [Candidatus Limnocylindrales bacterium]|nr:type I restriction enzyme endonuclease domain-containing protein [Candidatus Limnocylindrales bacterium]
MTDFAESVVEDAALAWLEAIGWRLARGLDVAPDMPAAERRAQLRVLVKRILRKHGYPPDKQEKATQTVLEQAARLSVEWALA